MPDQLTHDQAATIRDTISRGGTRDEAAAAAGIARSALDRHLLAGGQLADLRGGRRWRPRAADPTPAEIEVRAAELRSGWPEDRVRGRCRIDHDPDDQLVARARR